MSTCLSFATISSGLCLLLAISVLDRVQTHTTRRTISQGEAQGIAVQGNWVHIDADGHEYTTAQGAYTYIRADDLHGDRCAGPEVCINVLDFDGVRDISLPE